MSLNKIVVARQRFGDTGVSDMASLSSALLTKPAEISRVMTYIGGREDGYGSKRYVLTMLTEGGGNTIGIDSLEYTYNIFERTNPAIPISLAPGSVADLGKGGLPFVLTFPNKRFIFPYNIVGKSGTQVRIMQMPRQVGPNWEYTVQLINPDLNATLPAADVQPGALWSQLYAAVGVDWSRGNASNTSTPGKVKDKLTTIRKSYQLSRNANDFVMTIGLPKKDGGYSKYWMDFHEWQIYIQWKEEMETLYWYGERSYDMTGETRLRDENDQPIIIGPGVLQQIGNKETFSELTVNKIKNTIGDMFYSMTDSQKKEITLYTGTGGGQDFDEAMKNEMLGKGYTVTADGKFISGSGRNLTLTGYFTSYEHINGHTIKVAVVPGFDDGAFAASRAKHPRTGYSLESHRMVFLDTGSYEGEPNLRMLQKNGAEMIRWAVTGSVVPKGFTGNDTRASDIDGASVHYLKVGGVVLRRTDTSLDMQCVAN